jgi:ubiquinone/menaquinone biosynthesis C-methylase UbiE
MSAAPPGQSPPPQAQLMQMAMGYSVSFLLRAAAELRLADYLASGAKTAGELSANTGTHGPALYRLLRTLASVGVFNQEESGRFSLAPLGEPLRSDIHGSVRASILSITGDLFTVPWSKLAYSVQTGRSAFEHHFGVPFFDHLNSNPEEAAMFSELLIGINSLDAPAIAAAYTFTKSSHIADIGGGTGHILATILADHPGPRGTVFDLPFNEGGAAELIKSRGLSDRMTFVAGSFFENVPSGCDLYILSHIIHDWSEAQGLSILENCRRAMSPDSRLLIIEMVLPEGSTFHPGKMLDMTMLATTPGQERTEHEYRTLLEKARFKVTRVISTNSSVSIIEAIPA